MIMVCMMGCEKQQGKIAVKILDKAYFYAHTCTKLEKTNVKEIIFGMIYEILEAILNYQQNGSGWYFKEVFFLEIHIVDYKPLSS